MLKKISTIKLIKMDNLGSIEEYLAQVGRGRGEAFGKRYRQHFRDMKGTAELAMLAAPSDEEYEDFFRLVEGMTGQEKRHIELLNEEKIQEVAERCKVNIGNATIFINGYILASKQAQKRQEQ
ncbi:MAG: hypothetical protein GY869_25420 [Planctomycetes bacterium]|nr:hypothetical protein [Planctomycetota bacterium]